MQITDTIKLVAQKIAERSEVEILLHQYIPTNLIENLYEIENETLCAVVKITKAMEDELIKITESVYGKGFKPLDMQVCIRKKHPLMNPEEFERVSTLGDGIEIYRQIKDARHVYIVQPLEYQGRSYYAIISISVHPYIIG